MPKRKLGEADEPSTSDAHGSTIFVSNLPYTATSTDLQTLFSDLAPIRSAFVVLEGQGDERVSKGVGYVSFAMRQDAEEAFQQIQNTGLELDGRKLRAQWADQKMKFNTKESSTAASSSAPMPNRPQSTHSKQPRQASDPTAIRSIVISGLPADLPCRVLWKKLRKYKGCEKVDWKEDNLSPAIALFETPAAAAGAVSRLHAHVYKGAILSVTLKKHLDGLIKPPPPKKAKSSAKSSDVATDSSTPVPPENTSNVLHVAKGPAPSRSSRLIVRNLPYDFSEQDLRVLFLPYGPIYSVHIPLADSRAASSAPPGGPDSNASTSASPSKGWAPTRARGKGFAFVWFLSRKDATAALESVNGSTVRAGLAKGLMEDKQKRKKVRREEKKSMAAGIGRAAAKDKTDGDDEDERDTEGEGEAKAEEEGVRNGGERVVAVDWALSKDRWEEVKAKMVDAEGDVAMDDEHNGEGSDVGPELDDNSADADSDDGLSSDDSDAAIGVHKEDSGDDEESNSEENDSEADARSDEEARTRPTLPTTDTGTTVFVRNIPFEATEDELRTLFRAIGPLRYARITMDHTTGRSRGTGFACFWKKEDADRAVHQSELLRSEMGANVADTSGSKQKKNPFTIPSILTPDPSSSLAQSLVLHGRTLDVIRAVTRERAGELKEAGEKAREKADKRNLYLMREGVIHANSTAATSLPTAELEKRTSSYNARRALLRSNPSLYISKTRLSVRQIPTFVTERGLKRLAIHAVRAFEEEVGQGKLPCLTVDELAGVALDDDSGYGDVDIRQRTVMLAPSNAQPRKRSGKGGTYQRPTVVKQAKIVRATDRIDTVTGKGRSKGYGFLEMHTHADALRVLRWANNNPNLGVLLEEWWLLELGDVMKQTEKSDSHPNKEDEDEQSARMKRIKFEMEAMKARLEKRRDGHTSGDSRTLIMEFSIENVQVIKRRIERENAMSGETHYETEKVGSEDTSAKTLKMRGRISDNPKVREEGGNESATVGKFGTQIGGIIGKKRKERRMKRQTGQ